MFESLDSLNAITAEGEEDDLLVEAKAEYSNSIYDSRLADRLAGLNIFIVGAGAIGCELLKTLALMGAGTGRTECLSTIESYTLYRIHYFVSLMCFHHSDRRSFRHRHG